jgi:hypothetical protein
MKKTLFLLLVLSHVLQAQTAVGTTVNRVIESKYLQNTGGEKTACKISVY